ncbi:MAG: hypothetical protein ACLP0A_15755 [Verrucomicrobiia bacterium]
MRLTDRARIRDEMLGYWMREKPGGKDVVTRYRYNVERLADGSRMYLMRPAYLNKGCDFIIYCEGFLKYKNGNDKPPRQDTLFTELGKLTGLSGTHKREILGAVRRVWECENVDDVLSGLARFSGNVDAERLLKLAMWLFIEQDVTYWSYTGRSMLRSGIEERFGELP